MEKHRMKKYWRDKWVAALRSGEYAQTRGQLGKPGKRIHKKYDSFCCLGVLCDIVDDTKWIEFDDEILYGGENFLPPDSVFKKVGLLPVIGLDLSNMNDDGMKFPTIANYIENNL